VTGDTARYAVRRGVVGLGSWRRESVDLAQLHARAWPGANHDGTTVTFIGLAAAGDSAKAPALIADIVLSR
jgi:hypothetical protein